MKSFQIRDSILFQLDMCWQLYKYHTENLEEAEADVYKRQGIGKR